MFVGRYRTGKRLGILLLSRCFFVYRWWFVQWAGWCTSCPDFCRWVLRKFPSMDHRYKFRRLFLSIISHPYFRAMSWRCYYPKNEGWNDCVWKYGNWIRHNGLVRLWCRTTWIRSCLGWYKERNFETVCFSDPNVGNNIFQHEHRGMTGWKGLIWEGISACT